MLIYNRHVTHTGSVLPEYGEHYGASLFSALSIAARGFLAVSETLAGSRFLVYFAEKLGSGIYGVMGVVIGASVIALPIWILKCFRGAANYGREFQMAFSVAVLIACLPLFLFAVSLFVTSGGFSSPEGFLGESRFYWPLSVGGVCLAYWLCAQAKTPIMLRIFSGFFVSVFFLYFVLVLPFSIYTHHGFLASELTQRIFGLDFRDNVRTSLRYPEHSFHTGVDNTWDKIKELYRANPDAQFITVGFAPYFVLPWAEESRVFLGDKVKRTPDFGSDYWSSVYTSKNVTVYWITHTPTGNPPSNDAFCKAIHDARGSEVFHCGAEKVVIYVTELQQGARFAADRLNGRVH
jgi:hypothetical protein